MGQHPHLPDAKLFVVYCHLYTIIPKAGRPWLFSGSVARAGCVVATADAWSQLAQFSTRALPYRTALAVVSTLIATALVEYSLPLPLGFDRFDAERCVSLLHKSSPTSTYSNFCTNQD